MPILASSSSSTSNRALTIASYISFFPIGIATVLLGPMLPLLSSRWSLNYSQAGALFTAQYIASTCAVALSGFVVARRGYLFAIKLGLVLVAVGVGLLLTGTKLFGIVCIAAYGAGLGIAVPAANLLVAEVNPERRSATLNWLNFSWSAGAVTCPFLVGAANKEHHTAFFLAAVSALCILVALAFTAMPASIAEPRASSHGLRDLFALVRHKRSAFVILGALFFVYVGTENGFGQWIASLATSLGTIKPAVSLMTPSFFYASLMLGRWLAPLLLRYVPEVQLVRAGLLLACVGTAGMVVSPALVQVAISACAAGFGLACVYPITIALLSHNFGSASAKLGSVMFVLSNLGGGLLPWTVGLSATRFHTLKAGLLMPVAGCVTMLALYLVIPTAPVGDNTK